MGQQVSFLDNVGSSQLVAGGTHGQFVNDPLVASQIVHHFDRLQRHVTDVLHRDRVGDRVANLHVLGHIGRLRHDQLGIYFLGLNPFGSFGVGLFTLGAGAFGLDGIHILACQQVRLGDGVLGGEINALALGQQVDGLAQVGLIVIHRHVQQVHVTDVGHGDGVGHHIADLQTILNVSGLGHADLGHFGLVEDVIVSHRSGVTVHRLLNDGVLDCLTISILFQAVEGVLPAVLSGHGLARHLSGAVHHHHGNGSGTDLLLVVQVVPGLLAGDAGLVGLVGVDQFHGGFGLGLVPGQHLAGGLVASHLDLVDGVHNLLALAVLGQIGEGVLPVIGLSQGRSSRFVAAIHDLHNDALRTDLVLVVCIVPGLGNSDLNGLDVMGVLDVVAFVVRVVASHSHFGDLVGDLLTLGIHRQVIEGVLPVVRGGHGLAGDQLELVLALHDQQVHGDAPRTLAILVVGVVPSLHTGDAGGLRSMSVDQVEAIRLGGVAFHSFLGDGVDDLLAHLALAVLGQVGEGVRPAIRFGSGGGGHQVLAVHQLHGDLGRTDAILVVGVVPALHTIDLDGLGRMGVDQVEAIRLGGVAFHSFLGDGVHDLLALAVLGQVGEGVLPAISSGSSGSGYHVLAVHQLHGDLGGTDAILVVGVLPALHTIDLDGLGRMGVGDVVAFHRGLVAFHRLFGHGVRNGLASLVDRQVLEGVQPLAVAISGHGSALHLLAVSQQVHGDARGTLAILVVSVVPELLAGDAGGCGGMAVGNVVTVHLGLVTFNGVLGDAVLDLLTSHMGGQVFEAVLPAVLSSHGDGLGGLEVDSLHSSHQVHGDAVGTQAILVISVIPNLLAGDAGLARRVAVGDGDEASFLVGLDLGGVFIHLFFGHGVGDQLAASIGVQISEAELPVAVHVGSHIGAVNLRAISQQVHGDADRTLAILVFSVAPDLFAAHRGLDDLVGVGDGEVGDVGGVAFHRSLGDGVGDILTRLLHRQVGEGMLPLAILIDDDRLVHLSTIGQQLHLDVGGALAVLVLLVDPGLGHLDLGGGRHVGIDQRHGGSGLVSIPHQFLAGGGVASHSDLFDAISDLLTLLVLVEVGEAPLPAILGGSGGVLEGFAVLQQVDGDALGTQAVLIVGILPFLGAVDSNLLDLVGVGDVVVNHTGGVAGHRIFGDGVHDRLADLARLVHRQVLEAPHPAVFGGHGGRIDFHIISQQTHGDALGALAILVVVVLPGLGALHLGGVDVVGVGHDIAGSSVAGHGHFVVVRHFCFFHGILDLSTLAELVKVLEGVGPVVVGVQFNRLVGSLAISQQVDGHARGALVVLVALVVPDLGHRHFGLFDLVGVGDVVAVHGGGVDIHQILAQHFLNAVGNFLTISMGRQVGEAVLPLGLGVHSLGFLHLTVSQQVHGDGSRPLAVLVVRVVPDLGTGDAGHARSMGVGDGVAGSSVAGDGGLIAGHLQLFNCILNLNALFILGQVGELPAPAVGGLHFLASHFLAVGSQTDGDAIGTQAILVVLVLPDLGHADLGLLGSVGVGHSEAGSGVAGDGSLVAVHLILGNGVGDSVAVLVHRQIGEAELPFGISVHSSHLAFNRFAIGQQADGHALLADAVLVVSVVPHLDAFHLGGGDVVGVGDDVAGGSVAGDDRQLIAVHLLLSHGVDHGHALRTFLIDRKLFEGSAPVVVSTQRGGRVRLAVSQQLHGDALRTQAVAVAVVIPHLGHAHAGLAGGVAVFHVVVRHSRAVVLHRILGDGVLDLHANLALGVLGQVLPLPSPVIHFGHGLGIKELAVRQQVDGDLGGTDARHVVEVVPALLALHHHRFKGVGVGHVVATLGDLGGVAGYVFLGDGVDDLLAALAIFVELVLGQVLPLPSPVVGGGHGLGFLHSAVSQQFDGDLGGALAIPVALVIPGLGAFHRHHGGSMGVLDVVAGDGGGVAFHLNLGNGVLDLLASRKLGQVGEAVLPLGGSVHSSHLALNRLSVRQQLHGDAVGAQAILVVRIFPGLGAGDVDGLGGMAVGDGVAINVSGVLIHLVFADGVDDLLAVRILGQVVEAVLPVAVLISRSSGNGRHLVRQRHAVGVQTHGDTLGAITVLIVGVAPALGHVHLSLFGLVGVGDGETIDAGFVAFHLGLGHGVGDLRAIRILGQLGEGVRPSAIRGSAEGSILNLSAISQQLHGDGARTQAILILAIRPGLGHGHRGFLGVAGVGHGHGSDGVLRVPGHEHIGIIVIHRIFGDGVVDQLAALELVEVGEAELPLILGSHGHFVDLNASLQQVDGDALRTLAVLVVRIVPHLGAVDIDLLDLVGVDDVEVIDGRGVAFHLELFNRVLDLGTLVAILGQTGEAVRPVALGIGGNGGGASILAVRQQLHGDAIGALAILVVVVVPGLGAGDSSGFGSMGVGHGEASGSVASDDALVVLNLNFLNGVHNRSALIILVQVSEGSSPVVAGIQLNGLAGSHAISQQVDGHTAGTDAVLIATVFPNLAHGHRGLFGDVSVGHVVAILSDLGGVVRHLLLGDGIDDGGLLVVHVLVRGQISPLPSPVALIVRSHFHRLDLRAISQQVDGDALRPHLVAVVIIDPGLAAGNRGGFGGVGVGDGNILAFHLLGNGVARHGHLFNGVGNKLAVSILVQVSKVMVPVVILVQFGGSLLRTVSQQLHGDAVGSGRVAVLAVVPNLGYVQVGLAGGVGVGQGGHTIGSHIVGQVIALGQGSRVFLPGVCNLLAANKLVQTSQLSFPLAIHRQRHGLTRIHIISQQLNRQALRTLAILVVVVVPHLFHGQVDLFGGMGVGDVIAAIGSRVALHLILGDGVHDQRTLIAILGQAGEAVRPIASGVHSGRTHLRTISVQTHGDALRLDAVLVVIVNPGLGAGDVDGLGGMAVLNGEAGLGAVGNVGGVVSHRFLGHAVDDLRTVLKLGQVLPLHDQSIAGCVLGNVLVLILINHSRIVLAHLLGQVEGHGIAQAILVVVVIPLLGGGHRSDLGGMGVGDGDEASLCVLGLGRGVAIRHIGFLHGVGDRRGHVTHPLVHRQIGEAPGPAVLSSRRSGITRSFAAISIEVDGHAGRTDAILVVSVLPSLHAGNVGGVRLMSVGDGVGTVLALVDFRSVASRHNFFHGVNEFGAVGVLGQRSAPSPVAILVLGHLNRLLDNIAQLDVDGHSAGTQVILVVSVLPSLHAGNGDGLGVMLVGNGEAILRVAGVGNFVALRHRIFLHGVGDLRTVLLHVEVLPLHGQSVASSVLGNVFALELNLGFAHRLVEGQRHVGTLAVLVVIVVPHLGGVDGRGGGSMRIGNEEATIDGASHLGRVASRHGSLHHGVRNGRARAVLGQFLPLVAPAVAGIQRNRLALGLLASHQLHGHAVGTDAVAVFAVAPALGDPHVNRIGNQRVGDGEAVAIRGRTDFRLVIATHLSFFHRIGDLLAALINRLLLPCRGLVAQFDGLLAHLGLGAVHRLVQGHGHIGALAILVVVVAPHLVHGNILNFGRVAVGQGGLSSFHAGVGQFVALGQSFFIFRPGVLNFHTLVVLGQVLNGSSPVVAFVQSHFRAIGQSDLQLSRALAVLVAGVVPHLGHGGFRGFGGVAVGQGGHGAVLAGAGQAVALGHDAFRPGVGDFLASCLQRQISQLGFPLAIHRQGHRVASLLPISQQLDGQARRTLGILILRIVPHLDHGGFRGGGGMGVGHGQTRFALFVTFGGSNFLNSPYNGRGAAIILGQIGNGLRPFIARAGQRKGIAVSHIVSIQLQLNSLRTDAILVAVVYPLLGHSYFRDHGSVAVRNGKASLRRTRDRLGVVRGHRSLVHGVDDFRTISLQGQLSPSAAPVVALIQFNSLALGRTIGIQLHLNRRGTNAILVVRVVPRLGYGHAGLARRVLIGNSRLRAVGNVALQTVARRRSLRPSVADFLAVGVLRQVLNLGSPLVRLVQRHFRAVGQGDLQARRTQAVLVVGVVPHLGHGSGSLFGGVGVGDGVIPALHLARLLRGGGNAGGVISHRILSHGVADCGCGTGILRQVRKVVLPVIAGVKHNGILFNAVRQQMNRHARRLLAILIVLVVPHLVHAHRGSRGSVGVGQGGLGVNLAVAGQRVAAHGAFRPGIFDFLAICVLGQILNGGRPIVALVQGHLRAVGQCDFQVLRTQAVLIVFVLPHLGHGGFRGFGGVGVGHNQTFHNGFVLVGDSRLSNRVYDSLAILLHRQIGKSIAPLVASAREGSRIDLRTIRIKLNGHIFRTEACRVVGVVPDLLHNHIVGVNGMLVGHRQTAEGLDVILSILIRQNFVHGVVDVCAVGLLRNTSKGVFEAVALGYGYRLAFNFNRAVHQQQGDRGRANAIAVAVVVPHLGHNHIRGFRRVAVGDGVGNSLAIRTRSSIRRCGSIASRQRRGLHHRIGDVLATGLLVQGRPGVLPGISGAQRHSIAMIIIAGLQLHSNALGALAVLVVGVVPLLLHADVDFLNLMRVGQGGGIAVIAGSGGQRVVVHAFFRPGILNKLAIGILGQTGNGGIPLVRLVQRHFRAVGQGNLQALRTQAVLVVVVVPHLGHSHINKDGIQRVGDSEAGGCVAGNRGTIARDLGQFLHRVNNGLAFQLGIQIAPDVSPVIGFAEFNNVILRGRAVDHKLHLNRLRTLALSIVHVVPHLFDGDVHIFRVVGVGQRSDPDILFRIELSLDIGQSILVREFFLCPTVLNLLQRLCHRRIHRYPLAAVPVKICR